MATISKEVMEKVSLLSTWENNVSNMKSFVPEEGIVANKTNKYYRFIEYFEAWTKKVFEKNLFWTTGSMYQLSEKDNWVKHALDVVNKKKWVTNELPCLQRNEDMDMIKSQVYSTFLPVYRALKEKFDKRWSIEFIFNHRQYTAERDALKALRLLMKNMTLDSEEAFMQKYNEFLYEVPTSNVVELNRIYDEREKNKNIQDVLDEAEQNRIEREQLEDQLAAQLKEEKDLKDAEIQEKAVDELTASDRYTILTGDSNFVNTLEKEVLEAVGEPSKKALKKLMSKSAYNGAMEIAERVCNIYDGEREPLVKAAKEMFAKVHNIIGALGYPTLKDELIAVQKITDIVLKSATPCGFYEKEHGDIANGFVINDNDAIKDIIKNNEKKLNKNYTDEEIETAINEAKAMFVKKEVVNIDFDQEKQPLSSVAPQNQQGPIIKEIK